MSTPKISPLGILWASIRQHQVLLTTLLVVSIIAAGTNALFRAQLSGGPGPSAASSSSSSEDSPYACTSEGSAFEGLEKPEEAIELFRSVMSDVISEREELLKNKSVATLWPCFSENPNGQQPRMPVLETLAMALPGWRVPVRGILPGSITWVPKPVNFDSFESVIREFLREYECKLTEFQEHSPIVVLGNDDVGAPDEPDLDGMSLGELGTRGLSNFDRMQQERRHARLAVERTILTLRSYAMHAPFTVQMSCLQRATLDLKTELSLAADAMSCMPKIWDSVMSLHDRKYPYNSP